MVGGAVMQNTEKVSMAHLPIYTKEEILEMLQSSRNQIENGAGQEMQDALDEIYMELGI